MATKNFARALAATLRFEGGFANHPKDPGGATNYGITRSVLSDWRGTEVTAADVRAMTKAEATAIYRRRYWEMVNADRLPDGVDLVVFDYAVNSGVGRASRALQKVLDVTVDGIVGRDTVKIASQTDPARIIIALSEERRGFLRRLRIFSTFGRGWLRRVAAIEALALTMVPRKVASSFQFKPKETEMNYTKSIVESRTVWANLIGLAALGASFFGFDVSNVDQATLVDAALKGVAGIGFMVSTIYRIRATKKLA